jgi:hypothetical protein
MRLNKKTLTYLTYFKEILGKDVSMEITKRDDRKKLRKCLMRYIKFRKKN